jgi:hypothetical protein
MSKVTITIDTDEKVDDTVPIHVSIDGQSIDNVEHINASKYGALIEIIVGAKEEMNEEFTKRTIFSALANLNLDECDITIRCKPNEAESRLGEILEKRGKNHWTKK